MIYRKFLECDVVDVCNLSCKSCGHAAPYYKKNFYSFEQFDKDVKALSKVLHTEHFVIMGGEPLILGEKFKDYIQVIRDSGICDKIKLHTNGILAPKYTDLLKLCDIVYISLYNHRHVPVIEEWVNSHKHEFESLNIPLYVAYKTMFAEVFTPERLSEERAQKSWDFCGAKNWCNQLYNGYVFLCGPIAKFHKILKEKNIEVDQRGCSIHAPNLEERLDQYFKLTEKLPMCYFCLGHLDWHVWKQEKLS